MKSVISTTYDDKYLWFLPLVTYCWNKIGVDVICFMPYLNATDDNRKIDLINDTFRQLGIKPQYAGLASPKDKEATYAQCSRLYAACLDLPEDEVLIVGDVDLMPFKNVFSEIPKEHPYFYVIGADLVPKNQYPMCYLYARVGTWRSTFELDGKTYQQKLDELLGDIESEHFRGNYWSKDQETAYNAISRTMPILVDRSNGQNQFATHRVDRTDLHWRDRLDHDVIDAHLWRDGFVDENFSQIMELFTFMYPQDNFDWLTTYRNEYLKLL